MLLTYDSEADALYIELREGVVERTKSLEPGTLLDLDAHGRVVGVEVIRPARRWPVERVISEGHLPEEEAAALRELVGSGHARTPSSEPPAPV
jgi:uncharacterized protein YuzE